MGKIFMVRNSLLTKKAAIVGLSAAALLGGGVAYGYPSGTALTVSATAAPMNGTVKAMVSVANANPTCATRIRIDNGNEVVLPAGTTTTTIDLGTVTGRHSVTARTVDCAKGQKEHAKSKFVVLDGKATGDATAHVKKKYPVAISGFEPGTDVTVTATLVGSNPLVQVHDSDTVNKRGEAKTSFKFPQAGTWSVVTSGIGGSAPAFTVTVTN
jgi:hypothetical protein